MKKSTLYTILLFTFFILSTSMISESIDLNKNENNQYELLYDDIWGTIYHPVKIQCDKTPTITGDGSRINPIKASEHRWIAISQEMLDCEYRQRLLNNPKSDLYRGKIQYGDTVWIDSDYKEINGWWIVHDTKNSRYRSSIDFLQTKGDGRLYNDNKLWNGKFDNIKIYRKIKQNG